ncbi:carbohydrate-binding protein [Stigmatella aurantiaca]|uniref:Xylosidase/arabinosidase n=1 Tax=Stigmatella aurantiaca (strain DW4/3-1) TaxID=378806 RepID=E3FVW3_STIAD|nr:carbohydrate-binding protein [Stigmatella aurantiaca]ADO73503.1 Xylosidase/arabinosidase [Stigmatella aurantiaca DW4/3-1]
MTLNFKQGMASRWWLKMGLGGLLLSALACAPGEPTPEANASQEVGQSQLPLRLNAQGISAGSYTQVYVAGNANDANPSTYWEGAANAYPTWIRVDLGSASSVNQVVLKLPSAWGARTQTLSVQGSTDDVTYAQILAPATYTFSPSANTVTLNFAAVNARYVRLNFTANSGATGGQLSEFEVYGSAPPTANRSAFNQIAASSYDSQSGTQLEASSEGGQNVAFIDSGDSIAFNNVDFGGGATVFETRVASAGAGGNIEVRLDSVTGTLAGTCAVQPTGGWQTWATRSCPINSVSGVHNLYLRFTGSGTGGLFNVNWFKFSTAVASGGDVVGKLFAGYQGWFNAAGDGSPNNGWIHWSKNSSAPTPNSNVNFDLYPDLREYSKLYQTNLANLGNGQPAKLFSSYDPETVNKHFEWMRTYNIDGAALQRFGASESTSPDGWRTNRDSVAVKVKNAAEVYGRKFYVMYDITGMNPSTWVNAVKHDWTANIVNAMRLTSSSAYARQNGKLVVCIWGIGFTDRPGTAAEATDIINWFKGQGIYVIGGVPTYWRTGTNDSRTGFENVYRSLDMISPWFVGRFGGAEGADHYLANQWQPDYAYTQQYGIAYQAVIWPGFSWANLQGGPRNQIPRLHGDFMWRQAYNLKSVGISTGYVAMFDEYDEGTAIAKGAENSSMVPTNQYFLTLDADGVAVSSDFYLRLAGDINRLFKGQIPLTVNHPTSHQ